MMRLNWRHGSVAAVWFGGLVLSVLAPAAEQPSEPARQPLVLHARLREPAAAATGTAASSFVVKEKTLQWDPATDGDHHLRHVGRALVPGGDAPGRRAGARR